MSIPLVRNIITSHPDPGWNYGTATSPFFEFSHARDATYVVYNRRLMPVSFADADRFEDYWAFRRGAGLFDTGELPTEIGGPDAERLCDKVFTRNVAKLKPGRCGYGIACYPDGGVIVDGILMRLAEDRFWYVQADGDIVSWLIAQGAGMDVTISNPGSWVSQVQGPRAMDILAAALDGGAPEDFRYFDLREGSMAGQPVLISRTGWTGELGWEFYTLPGENFDGPALWRHVLDAGEAHGMIVSGMDCMDIRRIEAGILNNGSDIDSSMTPFQAGLGMFVDLDKPDFIGKEAIATRDRRCLVHGIRCEDGEPMTGTTVLRGDGEVGLVTAAAWSPYLGHGIGYARMAEPDNWDGEAVTVIGVDGLAYPAELLALPYYDADKHIARGLDTEIP